LKVAFLWVAAALAVLVRAPILGAGFVSDDYVLLAAIEKRSPLGNTPLNLWAFYDGVPAHDAALVAGGGLPWWTELTARHAFFRPLSSAFLTSAHCVFGHRAWAFHALTLLVCAGNVVLAGLVLARLLRPREAAIALLFFSVHAMHMGPALWISAVHIPLSMTFGLVALLAHIRAREDGRRGGSLLPMVALTMSLGAGEAGLATIPYFVLYESSARAPRSGRLRALLGPLGMALGYVALYRHFRLGAHAMAGYLDPAEGRWRFIGELAGRALHQLPRLATAPGEDLVADLGSWVPAAFAVCVGVSALGACGIFLRGDRSSTRSLVGWIAATTLAALPALAGPTDRALYAATLGASAVLGILFVSCAEVVTSRPRARGPMRAMAALFAGVLVLSQGLVAGAANLDAARVACSTASQQLQEVSSLTLASPEQTNVVVLLADRPTTGAWGGAVHAFATGRHPHSWQVLSMTPGPHRFTRLAADAFEVEPAASGGFNLDLYRNAEGFPMHPGDRVTTPGLTIEVLDVDGGRPTRIRVHAERSLEDPSWCFASRSERGLVQVRFPAVGKVAFLR
jgi:hypothetical protein